MSEHNAADAGTIELTVNGELRRVDAATTLAQLADDAAAGGHGVAVALDGEVVPRSAWPATVVRAGSRVEIVTAAAGG